MKVPSCHPEKKHAALGLCWTCYSKHKHERSKSKPEYSLNRKEKSKLWYKNNKEKHRIAARKCRLRKKYNITLDDYNNMFINQNNECAICKVLLDDKACVDHCHTTGRVRGLLCFRCNVELGIIEKHLDNLNTIKNYLGKVL